MSPITGACFNRTNAFHVYAVIFLCIILCGVHIFIMVIFGVLTYRNIRKTTFLLRLRVDRQLTIIVFIQILLTLVGLTPYGINATYAVITLNVQKNADQRAKEALADNITYLFASIAYGGRFYLFMLTSPRFRRMVKNRILQWQPSRRVIPLAK
ncbi:unnamed protein product [Rotaria sp. Silwood1]|nr:unnamed protein product [Rotaria sp. Silwood1]CAF5009183.1 unnamed protein product [Rotaria sp. Silwood1]